MAITCPNAKEENLHVPGDGRALGVVIMMMMIFLTMVWRQREERERGNELGEGTFVVVMEREDRVVGMRIEVK